MQLLDLTLYNFCLYKGEQTLDLSTTRRYGKAKPIVLIGGINGGGKTTLFDAVLLVLYGSRAPCSKRTNRPYSDFLADCIHRDVNPSDGASITLSFRYVAEGCEHIYEVCRRWAIDRGVLRETLTVSSDGEKDSWLSSNWNHVVEGLIPLGVSQLFFFDAEKIRFLAEDNSTNEAMGAAIKSMLGLDLVERLITDTKTVEMKLAECEVRGDDEATIGKLKEQLAVQTDELSGLKQRAASLRNDLAHVARAQRQAEEAFSRLGGDHWDARQQNEQRRNELQQRRTAVESSLLALAAGDFPVVLVQDLLRFTYEQDAIDATHKQLVVVDDALENYDRALVDQLEEMKIGDDVIALVHNAQEVCKKSREVSEPAEVTFGLSDTSRHRLQMLVTHRLAEECKTAAAHLRLLDEICADLDDLRRSLTATPKDAAIRPAAEQLKEAAKAHAVVEANLKRLEKDIEAKKRECDAIQKELEDKLLAWDSEAVKVNDARRMAALASRTRATMQKFLQRSTTAKIDRLAEYILDSFRFLLRKKTLVQSIYIDPDNFEILLLDSQGTAIPKQRLSEGEKQIFAVSVLWGLGRASRRRLPAIIDTPMARLDVAHRENLLNHYFPSASHQTIILSTDTEVDETYFALLEPHIARAYFLKYSERQRRTVVEEGYFWATEASEATAGT